MKIFLALLIFASLLVYGQTATTCGISKVTSRVIAGQNAKQGQWPWQVALYVNDRFSCGGTLIHPSWLVTAAHCIFAKRRQYKVVLGELHRTKNSSTEVQVNVRKLIKHPLYQYPSRLSNDIALIKLAKPVKLNDDIAVACLPKPKEQVPADSKCFISGWGKTKHPGGSAIRLQHAQMKIISNDECNKKNGRYNPIEPQMLCAANQNAKQSGCHGDSGGPFVCQDTSNGRWTLQGAVSWGSPRCDIADANTVFARVAEFRDWINKYVKV